MKSLFSNRRGQTRENYYGVALDSDSQEVVVAERLPGAGFQIWRVGLDEHRAVNIADAEIRTAALGWSAHTDRSQSVDGAAVGADDEAVLYALVDAAKNIPQAERSSFSWSRTPDRKIAITQAERSDIERTAAIISPWLSAQVPPHLPLKRQPRLRIETATRAIARLWLSEAGERSRKQQRTVAFVTVGREGYAVGLWSAEAGLIYETEELFEADASPEMAIAHTCESVVKLTATPSLARLSLESISTIVVSAVSGLEDTLIAALTEALFQHEGVMVERVCFSGTRDGKNPTTTTAARYLDQATALALGFVLGGSQIPAINLASSLDAEYEALVAAKQEHLLVEERRVVTIAKAAMFAPLVLAASVMMASYVDLRRESSQLSAQTLAEQSRAEALKAEAALRVTAKQHFSEYVTLTDQMLELRRRQPATAQLLNDLNHQWPTGDTSWFISEMRTMGGGLIELKGRTAREESVTAFTRGLEFSNGLFTNISNNIQTANFASGEASKGPLLLDFTIRAIYTPLLPLQGNGSATQGVVLAAQSEIAKGVSQ